jgi:hypothetical protein
MIRSGLYVSILLAAACGDNGNNGNPDLSMPVMNGADMAMETKTTIAAARGANVMGMPITVDAIVTAVRGDSPATAKTWYIEDPAGGPNSGVAIYCNKSAKSNPCPMTIMAPALHDKITITGTLASYKGEIEMYPTAQTTVMANAALPPIPTLMPSDVVSSGTSMNRGTLVKVAVTLTVDDVTPAKLYDTQCANVDGGTGTMPLCSGCAPPSYSGFQANDGMGHEVIIENTFYNSENLASSPECLTAMGAIPVHVGDKFTTITGILDFDPNGMVQALSPVQDSDYTKQ